MDMGPMAPMRCGGAEYRTRKEFGRPAHSSIFTGANWCQEVGPFCEDMAAPASRVRPTSHPA
eukprot:4040573-Prymnesium_polylepis.2